MFQFSKKTWFIGIGFILLLPIIYLIFSQYDYIITLFIKSEVESNVENGVQKWDGNFIQETEQKHQQKFQSYFVHTKGCKMPSFPVADKNIEKFMIYEEPIYCGKPLTRSNNSYLWIDLNETEINKEYGVKQIEDLQCQYKSIRRITDFKNEYDKLNHTFGFGDFVKVHDEYICITCKLNSTGKQIYQDYDFFVPDKHKETSKSDELNSFFNSLRKVKSHSNDNQTINKPMSVMILGVDSVSRLNFHRQMNESANVLSNDLKAVELFGFNKVGDNTYPNMMPVLSGLNETEIISACNLFDNRTYDKCDFIWKAFKAKDFTTVFAEDVAEMALFQAQRPGFINQPTDYNFRPIIKEMENHIANYKYSFSHFCMEKRRTIDIFIDYARKIIDAMKDRLYFSFLWTASFTHGEFHHPKHIDAGFAGFLRWMQSTGALNNLFLIVMSDHGIRWGSFRNTYQGMMEERQPFVFFVPPKRFSQQYPEAMRNLVKNRHALTTHFDLYETLHDLTNLETIESEKIIERTKRLQETDPMPRGISLFLPVPESRTCAKAEIASHWCTCNERTALNQTDPRIMKAAETVVNHLNDLLKPYPQCHPLELNNLFGGSLEASNNDIRNGTSHFVDINVRLQTKPGFGEFEATTRIHDDKQYELTGKANRTNLYGKQSHCIDDFNLKLYCYCNDQI